ncbi:aminotransferase class V-fold PLP-dependent enzyme [Desulfuribacillus alkaliarsenatis]|uniref:Aminotransferase class V domain-containing protein n=1 Tax=Desulfuribacillus alkaliarsenatis TaxID=766136 RepID=A0A1E5G155_9FIRM|nr:aminotransferase class V-fold PLP-dependent enzyme [Desulfuribacillus alkaliarsenatis]OEF96635.1 hypothetical protein BHF68_08310 [Desulfuribacillus alkaliarsenatis]
MVDMIDIKSLKHEILGNGSYMQGPYGERLITYADYVASGKYVRFLENYYIKLYETYANTHTTDDITGRFTTGLYNDALAKIKKAVGANKNYSIIPVGTGATGAIDKLSKILGIYKTPEYFRQRELYVENSQYKSTEKNFLMSVDKDFHRQRPVVFISSYEHHSNELQWREGHAEVVKIGLDNDGLFDLNDLKRRVSDPKYTHRLKIGSFSAASNVTGLKTPVYDVAKIMHQHGGYVFFDYAACGPYVEINMCTDKDAYFDGIYLAMHKFLGGPSSSGILVLNKQLYNKSNPPTTAGGGTVRFVTEANQYYLAEIEEREAAGTPGIMQVIRAALALELKHEIGIQTIENIESGFIEKAISELRKISNIELLGNLDANKRLAVLSFNIRHKDGYLHYGFVSSLLNDLFGIQSRAGCACAGPYGIKLLNIEAKKLKLIEEAVLVGNTAMKPGWVRVNFHYTMDTKAFDYIIAAIKFIAKYGYQFLNEYRVDIRKGTWTHKQLKNQSTPILNLKDAWAIERVSLKTQKHNYDHSYDKYLYDAEQIRKALPPVDRKQRLFGKRSLSEASWFYHADSTEIVIKILPNK